ncbi:threonine synthase [Natrarchaeobius chitinivorans]|uniref:Threonine synthase n=1 Tax=Natrarchaeobius chitinivorans TaxID=1679083 RepID=A0A3N6LYL4_NATCH|nr:threonine synthase [Natrarchaeobius chitinivorans]RQG94187.1 threonine synthase [Natrarchaeobius chitinivorans]
MEPFVSVFDGYRCFSCKSEFDPTLTSYPCPSCGGILDPKYRYDDVAVDRSDWNRRCGSMWQFGELLGVENSADIVSAGEGGTPLVNCPRLANRIGVGRLFLKDEGQNPTNTFKDRGQSAAISVANAHDVGAVGIPSAGNDGQSASFYSARAGIDCEVFMSDQADQLKKDLVKLHGATLHLLEGDISEASAAFEEAKEQGLHSVSTYQTPHKHDGMKTMTFEIASALDWTMPDHVVYPTGSGTGLLGLWKGYRELDELGWLEDSSPPAMTVSQSDGAAPIVRALEAGADEHTPWSNPESIAKGIEIPNPKSSALVIERVRRSGGYGVAVPDEAALDAALEVARTDGVEMSIESAVALAGTIALAEDGEFTEDDDVVVINTGGGCKTPRKLAAALD